MKMALEFFVIATVFLLWVAAMVPLVVWVSVATAKVLGVAS